MKISPNINEIADEIERIQDYLKRMEAIKVWSTVQCGNVNKMKARLNDLTKPPKGKSAALPDARLRKVKPYNDYFFSKRSRALSRGHVWDLTYDDFLHLIPEDGLCPITRRKLIMPGEEGDHWDRLSIDKFIPSLGYVKGNVAVISKKANTLKNDVLDSNTFRRLAEWMDTQTFKFVSE